MKLFCIFMLILTLTLPFYIKWSNGYSLISINLIRIEYSVGELKRFEKYVLPNMYFFDSDYYEKINTFEPKIKYRIWTYWLLSVITVFMYSFLIYLFRNDKHNYKTLGKHIFFWGVFGLTFLIIFGGLFDRPVFLSAKHIGYTYIPIFIITLFFGLYLIKKNEELKKKELLEKERNKKEDEKKYDTS